MIVQDHCHWLQSTTALVSHDSQFCVQYATISMACGQSSQKLLELLENSMVDTDPNCQQLELSLDSADQASLSQA